MNVGFGKLPRGKSDKDFVEGVGESDVVPTDTFSSIRLPYERSLTSGCHRCKEAKEKERKRKRQNALSHLLNYCLVILTSFANGTVVLVQLYT